MQNKSLIYLQQQNCFQNVYQTKIVFQMSKIWRHKYTVSPINKNTPSFN